MSLDGNKKLPSLRPSRDLKLTGANKPKKQLFTPNIPNRKRPTPSQSLDEDTRTEIKKRNSHDTPTRFKPFSSSHTHTQSEREGKRTLELNKRKNNVIITTSIFSCGLAEKAIRRQEQEGGSARQTETIEERNRPPSSDEQTAFPAGEDEYLDPYDPSVPRVLPLDQDIYSRHRDSKMVSQWNNMPPVVSPCWPGLYPSPAAPGEMLDTSLPSDIFNAAGDKAQIIFLQIPDKFPVQRPRRSDETEIQYLTAQKHGRAELSSLKQLPQASVGQLRVHASGKVSIQMGDAVFNLLNATPASFLQELVVIDHPPGSAQGQLTHLGYLSGRMMAAAQPMPGKDWLPKDRYLNTSSMSRLLGEMELLRIGPFEFYSAVMEMEDPRTKDWPLMSSPFPTFFLVFLYMLMVYVGPILMRHRKEWDLQYLLFFYNFAMVGLSTYIATEAFFGAREVEYSWLCQPMIYSTHPGHMRVANALWWYYFSKCIEFLDTLFFILRKKNNQITFLHIYHHATMFGIWWMGIAWVAGGQSTLGAILNSIVHIVMYTYYGLSAFRDLRPYLWWKRYITDLQLAQFGSGVVLGAYTITTGCNFPMWMQCTFVTYAITFLFLFGNFYYHTYIKKRRVVKPERNGQPVSVSKLDITE